MDREQLSEVGLVMDFDVVEFWWKSLKAFYMEGTFKAVKNIQFMLKQSGKWNNFKIPKEFEKKKVSHQGRQSSHMGRNRTYDLLNKIFILKLISVYSGRIEFLAVVGYHWT